MKLLSTGHTDDWQWQKLAVRAGINLLIEEYVVQADSYSVLRRVKNVIYSSSSSLFCLWCFRFLFENVAPFSALDEKGNLVLFF